MANPSLAAVLRQMRGWAARYQSQSLPDHQLLGHFLAQRDEAAFAALVRRHGGMVLSVARRILHDAHAAEDVFQNTFLTLARRAGSIRKRESLAGWLYGVAARLASQMQLRDTRRAARERETRPLPAAVDVAEAVAWRELGAVLDEELQRLPEKYRIPLVHIYFTGQTQEEAARQLGWSERTLRRRLERGKRLLHDRLSRRGVSLSVGLLTAGVSQSGVEAALPPLLVRQTIGEAVRMASAQAALGVVGMGSLMHAKIALVLGLLIVGGAGVAVLQIGGGEQPKTKQEESAKPPAYEAKRPRVDRFGDPLPEGASARLGTMRFRHGGGVSLAFAPDGKTLLSCGSDRVIRTWDTASGRLLGEQRLPDGPFSPIAVLSPDARFLAFEDTPGTLSLWDVARHRSRHKLAIKSPWPRAAFSPDGKRLVVGEEGGAVRVWDTATGKDRLLGEHKGMVYTLAFSDDGSLMSLGADQTVRIWDVTAGRERFRFTVPEEVVSAAISPDRKIVATWTQGNAGVKSELQFWDAASGEPKKDWKAPDMRAIHTMRFLPDGKTILVGAGWQGDVRLWDAVAGKRLRTLPGKSGWQFVLSPDGKTAASLGGAVGRTHFSESMVHVWDLATGARHDANNSEYGHLVPVGGMAFTPDGRIVASFSIGEGRLHLWDAASGRSLHSLALQKEDLSSPVMNFTPDGKYLSMGTCSSFLRWEVATGREVLRYRLFDRGAGHALRLMHLSDDGRTLSALEDDLSEGKESYILYAWDMTTRKRIRSLPLAVKINWASHFSPDARFQGRFSPDGRLLAMPDGGIFDTATGKELRHLSLEGKSLGAPIAFSSDGALIAMSIRKQVNRGSSGWIAAVAVQVWEAATLSPVTCLEVGELNHLAFTPDGRHLVTGDVEMLKLWNLASGRVVARQRVVGHIRGLDGGSFASSLALAPNGRTVATAQPDTTILLWNLSPPTLDRSAATLTAVQREAYWTDLAGDNGNRALGAIVRLADEPEQTVPMLRDRLHAAKAPSAEELRQLLADLDHAEFARREKTTKRLAELGELAQAALREALQQKPSLEVRRRIDNLLAASRLVQTPEERRHLRAVRVLESIGTVEARQVLETLAKGAADARRTKAAKDALRRLAR